MGRYFPNVIDRLQQKLKRCIFAIKNLGAHDNPVYIIHAEMIHQSGQFRKLLLKRLFIPVHPHAHIEAHAEFLRGLQCKCPWQTMWLNLALTIALVIAKKTLNEILDTLITQCQTKNTNAVRIVSKRGEIVSDVIQTWT